MKLLNFYLSLFICLILITVSSCTENENSFSSSSSEITIDNKYTNLVIPQDGGTFTIPFSATNEWNITTINDRANSWLTITPVSGGKGEYTLSVIAAPNESTDERNATINIKSGAKSVNIIVTQKQKNALTVSSSKYEIPSKGGNFNIEVKANVDYEVEIKVDWIKQINNQNTRALKSNTLNFKVEYNDTESKREGEIIIKSENLSETIKVYQGFEDFIVISKDNFTLPEEGGNVDIEIKSTVDYNVKMISDEEWISEIQSRAVSTHTYHYFVSPNDDYESREAKIVFYNAANENIADTVSIYQMYKGAILIVRDEYQYGLNGGKLNLKIESNIDFNITISDNWIEQIETRGLTEYELNFNILKNTSGKDRTGTITINDKNSDKQQIIHIKQSFEDIERKALIEFYQATGGDQWINNTNWCSDKPLNEWYGIKTTQDGELNEISLWNNNLSGSLPDIFECFPKLQYINLGKNNLTGYFPNSLYKLDIISLTVSYNKIEGTLEQIGNWQNLRSIDIHENNFNGTIPAILGNLPHVVHCNLMLNQFSGELYPEIIAMEQRSDNDEEFRFFLEPQQEGYYFINPTTRQMIELGDNFYLHPEGLALEYRQEENKAITIDEMKPVLKKLYNKFNDEFDFIACLYNVGNMAEISGEIAGQAFTISNNVKGIDREIIDKTEEFGSSGRLKSIFMLSDRRQIRGAFLHELMHNWGALNIGQSHVDLSGELFYDPVHWGVSSVNGILGGFDLSTLERNIDGNSNKYKAVCSQTDWSFGVVNSSNTEYAPLELYLMGFIPANEVPDIHYFTGISGSSLENPSKNGIFYAEEEHIVTIEDLILKYGERNPDYTKSQKDFNVLTIVITKNPVNDREWALIEDDIRKMQIPGKSGFIFGTKNFYEATGGRGTLTFDGLEKYRK